METSLSRLAAHGFILHLLRRRTSHAATGVSPLAIHRSNPSHGNSFCAPINSQNAPSFSRVFRGSFAGLPHLSRRSPAGLTFLPPFVGRVGVGPLPPFGWGG